MKYLVSLLLILLFATSSRSEVNPVSYYDSTRVKERKVDTDALNEYAQDKDFQYQRNLIQGPNLLEQLATWLLEKLFGNYSAGDVKLVYRIFLILLIVIAASVLIFYLSKIGRSRLITSKGQDFPQVQFLDFDGSSSDLEKQWLEAEREKNFPLALRYLFIKTLYFLKEANSIEWKKEKTNSDYLNELKERWQRGPFQELSNLFAYTQYGGYDIREEDYRSAKTLYESLLKGGKGEQPYG
ncbi:MAG: DUF4129 domain-containing protein [Bacteroidia bacterium]